MVRTSRPLVERMTLVWHDWFATSLAGVGSQKLMLDQNRLLRRLSLGSFDTLLHEITKDPAMLLWLSGTENTKWSPNENYARELMELFTLGAGRGYTERDVREQARALTGFDNDWRRGAGDVNFRFDRERHDAGTKRIFGKSGAFDWQDAVRLCLHHTKHPSFFVDKLWRYFIPVAPDAATRRSLEALYRKDYEIRPVVDAILRHPALYTGPRMVKPPAVYTAGLLRALGRGVDTTAWAWLASGAGQRLFMPPNVSGWDDERWLDTATFRGRWEVANYATQPYALTDKQSAELARRAEGARRGGARLLGLPDDAPGDEGGSGPLRHERDVRREREVEADELPLPRRERAPPADRRVPRPPDLVRTPWPAAATTSRAPSSSAGPLPRPDAACPRSRAGMPLPAGTGLDRRSFLARTAGPRARRLRRLGAPARGHSRRGSPRPRRPGRRRCSSPSSSTAAPTRSRCSSPTATRSTATCARSSALPASAGTPVRRGPPPALASVAGAARAPCTARAR